MSNETNCELIENDYLRENCLTASEDFVETLSDEDLYAQALQTEDYLLCEEIQSEYLKQLCHDRVG